MHEPPNPLPEPSLTSPPPTPPSTVGELRTIGEIAASIVAKLPSDVDRARAEQLQLEAIERQERATRQRRWLELVAQVGRRYESARLATFEANTEAQRSVVESLSDFAGKISEVIAAGRNLVLFGPRGTGKDHLLVAMMRAAIADGWTVAWRDGQSLFSEFRDAIDTDRSEAKLFEPLTSPGVFALSDPTPPTGDTKSDWQRSILFRIIYRRYRDLKPTWVTINAANIEEAEKRITPNIIDRLSHDAVILRCNWKSFRTGR